MNNKNWYTTRDDEGPNVRQLAEIKDDLCKWNNWKSQRPNVTVNLQHADLRGADLIGAELSGALLYKADLSGAKLTGANLEGADLSEANLTGSGFNRAKLRNAKLRRTKLSGANLSLADLHGANLFQAEMQDAYLRGADLTGTDLRGADMSNADVTGVKFDLRAMRKKCLGVKGSESVHGNALFKRAVADQDYIDALEAHWQGSWRRWLFRAWGLIDYGRSIWAVVFIAMGLMTLFGIIYTVLPGTVGLACDIKKDGCMLHGCFTPFYFSIVTFTTLGFGDISAKTTLGEVLVTIEVLFGYTSLGLLLSVLGDKVARRS